MTNSSRRFCIAPMIDVTDRHFRYLARLASRRAVLFTEMITTGAIINGDRDYLLGRHVDETPVVLQLGGGQVEELAQACQIAAPYAYDEINLNVGCPSDKVQNHMIGACLMTEPLLVKDCLQAMADNSQVPVTIKHRIGLDDDKDYDKLAAFIDTVSGVHCQTFYVHARNAYLQGLSPKQNREIPPLEYNKVYRLKTDFPHLQFVINGGIMSIDDCHTHLQHTDGVMLGRAAYHHSALLLDVDQALFSETHNTKSLHPKPLMPNVIQGYLAYMDEQHHQGVAWHHMAKHLMGLCHGLPGARNMRRHISENITRTKKNNGLMMLHEALAMVTLSA